LARSGFYEGFLWNLYRLGQTTIFNAISMCTDQRTLDAGKAAMMSPLRGEIATVRGEIATVCGEIATVGGEIATGRVLSG
jgi:hypothetical protein